MHPVRAAAPLVAALFGATLAAADGARVTKTTVTPSSTTSVPACTASSSTGSGAFFDLRSDIAYKADEAKAHKSSLTADYKARGWDYGKNFTLNICGAVVEPVTGVVGIDKDLWRNVSAYYVSGKETFSIG